MSLDLKYFKKDLEKRQTALLELIGTETEETRRPVELDQAKVGRLSRMDALQVQAMGCETDRRRQVELQNIKNALKRIETNKYGLCISCEEDIAKARLKANPAALTCILCA